MGQHGRQEHGDDALMAIAGRTQDDFSLEQFAFITVFLQSQQLFVGPDFDGDFHDESKRARNAG